jgi:hypothetical protein
MPNTDAVFQTWNLSPARRNFIFNHLVFLIGAFVSVQGILGHSLWRDEVHVWNFGLDSEDIISLYKNMYHQEGHPLAWHALILGVQQLTTNILALKVVQTILSLGCLALITYLSPFKHLEKLLIVLGYYISFEYGVISRSYTLGTFIALVYVVISKFPNRQYFLYRMILLSILANTSLFGFFLSSGFFSFELFHKNSFKSWKELKQRRNFYIGYFMLLVSWVFSLSLMWEDPKITYIATPLFLGFNFEKFINLFKTLLMAFFPLPDFQQSRYWNTLFIGNCDELFQGVVYVTIIGSLIMILRRLDRAIASIFLITFIETTVLCYTHFNPSLRHIGIEWIAFLGTIWISIDQNTHGVKDGLWRAYLVALLLFQAISGITIQYLHTQSPFSAGETAANWIQDHHLQDRPLLGDHDWGVSVIAGYLNRPVYYPRPNNFRRRASNALSKETALQSEVNERLLGFMVKHPDAILIFNYSVPEYAFSRWNIYLERLAQFERSQVEWESFYIYQIRGSEILSK